MRLSALLGAWCAASSDANEAARVKCSGLVLTDVLIICKVGSRKQTPWLLEKIHHVLVNQQARLSTTLHDAADDASAAPNFGAPPPDGVPMSRLLNLRVLPDEEIWLDYKLDYERGPTEPWYAPTASSGSAQLDSAGPTRADGTG